MVNPNCKPNPFPLCSSACSHCRSPLLLCCSPTPARSAPRPVYDTSIPRGGRGSRGTGCTLRVIRMTPAPFTLGRSAPVRRCAASTMSHAWCVRAHTSGVRVRVTRLGRVTNPTTLCAHGHGMDTLCAHTVLMGAVPRAAAGSTLGARPPTLTPAVAQPCPGPSPSPALAPWPSSSPSPALAPWP